MTSRAFLYVYLAFVALLSYQVFRGSPSSDLMATWMAGKYFFDGNFDQIYTHYDHLFTMRPPSDWLLYLRANGYNEAIYPFIYPPLWAWVASWLHYLTTFETFAFAATFVNPILLGLTIWLAAKTAAEKIPVDIYSIIMTGFFAVSLSALIALQQNQPQVLVGFLMVLAVERTRAGSPIAGGIAMALAASLKLYPIIFALLWLATGDRRAAIAFAIAGAGLGILSIATSGWPLHAVFLSDVAAISRTGLITLISFSIDTTVVSFFADAQKEVFASLEVFDKKKITAEWAVVAKPVWLRALDLLLMFGSISFLFLCGRSEKGKDPLFWPMAFTLIAVISPLSWGYHYLPALAFALILFERTSAINAAIFMLLIFYPSSLLFLAFGFPGIDWQASVQLLSTVAMVFYVAILWFHLKKPA